MGFSLRQLFDDITGHQNPTPVQAPQKPSNVPTLAQFTQAMLATKPQDLPQDNLDGTYNNLQPGKGAVINPGVWHAPLLPGHIDGSQVAMYSPLAKSAGAYTNDSYYAIPINPNAVPQQMPQLKMMIPGAQ